MLNQSQAWREVAVSYVPDTVISTAQNLEDVLLFRAFKGKRDGFYVDVGAGDPNWESITNWFYRVGWTGINLEPNPLFNPAYAYYRTRDINLNVGVSSIEGEMPFIQVQQNEVGHGWGLSSFESNTSALATELGFKSQEIMVKTIPLRDIFQAHVGDREIDFLKIDVEGHEMAVLKSSDWSRWRPVVVCVESVHPNSAQPTFQDFEPFLKMAGYISALFDGVNSYYVREESSFMMPQFNAGVNCNDHYRKATSADFL